MPVLRTNRRSKSFGSSLPVLLVTLVIFSLIIANLNLIFILFQNVNKNDDQHHRTQHVIEEASSMKEIMVQNKILQFNLSRCRAKKQVEFEPIATAIFLPAGSTTKSAPTLNNVTSETRQSGSINNRIAQHRLANELADNIRYETQMTISRKLFNYMANNLRDTAYPGMENYIRYAVARLGLLPSTRVDPIMPGFGPVINEVLNFRYPLAIAPCNCTNDRSANKSVFIAVVSACGNFYKRDTIRQTWKQHLKAVQDEGLLVIAGFAFILGLPADNHTTQQQIEDESQAHGDIIQIGMFDYYRNLPLKGVGLFNWLHANCADRMDFVAKVDDDVYVNVRNLASFVQSHYQSNRSIFGVGKPRAGWPDRGKWAMTFEEWPWREYPPYMLGAIVLMSADAILPLLAACQTTPMIPLEDVYLYGICAKKAGIRIRYSAFPDRALVGSIIRAPTTCELRTLIAWRPDHLDATKVRDIIQLSHRMTDSFYRNTSQCIIKFGSANATDVKIADRTQFVHFTFN